MHGTGIETKNNICPGFLVRWYRDWHFTR